MDEVSKARERREQAKARGFLEALRDHPFVAVTIEDGRVKVYQKSLNPADLDEILAALGELAG